jgi:hypothetical protein
MNLLQKVFQRIKEFFTGDHSKAEQFAKQVTELADHGLEAAALVAKLTPTPVDDLVIAGLERMNKKAEEILSEHDKYKRAGMLMGLASETLRSKLINAVQTGGKIVKIGDQTYRTVEDILGIPDTLLNSAVVPTYGMLHAATTPPPVVVEDTTPKEVIHSVSDLEHPFQTLEIVPDTASASSDAPVDTQPATVDSGKL